MEQPQAPNPYEAPIQQGYAGAPTPIDDTPFPASRGRRFGNLVIDTIVVGVVAGGCSAALLAIGLNPGSLGLGLLPQILAYALAYVLPEALFGRTLGKFATGTKVVDENGGPPSIGQVIGRTLIRLVPFDALSFLWGDDTGWHDQWSKTLVVPMVEPYSDIT